MPASRRWAALARSSIAAALATRARVAATIAFIVTSIVLTVVYRSQPQPFLALAQFAAALPVYFHVLLLINLGLWCWASNVHGLLLAGVDVNGVLLTQHGGHNGDRHHGLHDFGLQPPSSARQRRRSSAGENKIEINLATATSSRSASPYSSSGPFALDGPPSGDDDDDADDDDNVDGYGGGFRRRDPPRFNPPFLYRLALRASALSLATYLVFRYLAVTAGWGEEPAEVVVAAAYAAALLWLAWPFAVRCFARRSRRARRRGYAAVVVAAPPLPSALALFSGASSSSLVSSSKLATPSAASCVPCTPPPPATATGSSDASPAAASLDARLWLGAAAFRVACEGIDARVPFCDVVLADVLTSFSRVLGDLHLAVADLLQVEPADAGGRPSPDGAGSWSWLTRLMQVIGPVLVALPFLFRLRQCIAEYRHAPVPSAKRRHFWNALKYASSFPVIATSLLVNWARSSIAAAAAASSTTTGDAVAGGGGLAAAAAVAFFAWVLASLVNTCFALYWDIAVDWQLAVHIDLSRPPTHWVSGAPAPGATPAPAPTSQTPSASSFSSTTATVSPPTPSSSSSSSSDPTTTTASAPTPPPPHPQPPPPPPARPLHFRPRALYPAAVLLNTLLRAAWLVRAALVWRILASAAAAATASGTRQPPFDPALLVAVDLALKALEVVRRWVWVFFRVEREWVGGAVAAAQAAGAAAADGGGGGAAMVVGGGGAAA
ncbi:EXS family-domain-containing protein [Zopfochytrium polystomum]|nr:EXS family-domain-containing protein [Zopfochytrium polystomum]